MRKLLAIAGLLVSALAFAGGPSLSNNGWKGVAAASYGTITLAANGWKWCYSNTGTLTSFAIGLGSANGAAPCTTGGAAPSNGDLVVLILSQAGANTITSITDNFADSGGGAWTAACGPNVVTWGDYNSIYYRQIGTGASGNVITITTSAATSLMMNTANFHTTSGTFSTEGACVTASGTSTAPATGNITTASSSSLIVAEGAFHSGLPTARTYTSILESSWNNPFASQYTITTSSGSYNPGWTLSSSMAWNAQGIGFKAQ